MKSDAFLLRQVMRVRLEAFLEHEARRQVKELVCLEQKGDRVIDIASGPVKCTYRVDRIDRLFDGSLLIIDYKSGGSDIKPINLARIREQAGGRRALKHTLKSFQLPLYYYCLGKTHDTLPVNACLYSLKDGRMDFFLKADELGSRGRIFADIESMLESLIAELWDPGARFEADDDDPRYCRFCPFAQLCR